MIKVCVYGEGSDKKDRVELSGTSDDLIMEGAYLIRLVYNALAECDEREGSDYYMSTTFKDFVRDKLDDILERNPKSDVSDKEKDEISQKIVELRKTADELENLIKQTKDQTKE